MKNFSFKKLTALVLAVSSIAVLASCSSDKTKENGDGEVTTRDESLSTGFPIEFETDKPLETMPSSGTSPDKTDKELKAAALDYYNVYYLGNFEGFEATAPDFYWAWLEKQDGYDKAKAKTMLQQLYILTELRISALYGDSHSLSVYLYYSDVSDKEYLGDMKEFLSLRYGISKDSVTDSRKIAIKKCVNDDFEIEHTNAVKVDGKWYVAGERDFAVNLQLDMYKQSAVN